MATTAAALITPHLIPYCVTRPAMPTGKVIASSVWVSTSANKNSFHETIRQKTAVAARATLAEMQRQTVRESEKEAQVQQRTQRRGFRFGA